MAAKIAKAIEPPFNDSGDTTINGGRERIPATIKMAIDGDAEALTNLKLQEASIGFEEISSVDPMVILVLIYHHC